MATTDSEKGKATEQELFMQGELCNQLLREHGADGPKVGHLHEQVCDQQSTLCYLQFLDILSCGVSLLYSIDTF